MEVKDFNLRFIKSSNYLSGTEFDLNHQFKLNVDNYFFPESLPPYYEKFLAPHLIPSFEWFLKLTDSEELISEKRNFYENFKNNYKSWIYEKELTRYCEEKLIILGRSFLQLFVNSLEFELSVKKDTSQLFLKQSLMPFGYNMFSIATYTYKLYKLLFLNREKVYCVKNEYGVFGKQVSKIEYEWTSYKVFQNPSKSYLSAFNNPYGQKYFKECIPDLYCVTDKEAFFSMVAIFMDILQDVKVTPEQLQIHQIKKAKHMAN
jgi:hypothetical protein